MYEHEVMIFEPGGGSYDEATKTWTPGDSPVLWEGKADVQEEGRGLHHLRMQEGETQTAKLDVFLDEKDWSDVSDIIRLELICVTPLGTGPVQGIRHLDQMLIVQPTKSDAVI